MCDSHTHGRMGYIEKVEALALHSLALLRQYGPSRDEGMALLSLNYTRQGKLQAARQRFQTGLALARQTNHRWDEVISLAHLGQIAQQLGELQQTRLYCEECILASHEMGDCYHLAKAHYHLGQVYQAEGSLQQA